MVINISVLYITLVYRKFSLKIQEIAPLFRLSVLSGILRVECLPHKRYSTEIS